MLKCNKDPILQMQFPWRKFSMISIIPLTKKVSMQQRKVSLLHSFKSFYYINFINFLKDQSLTFSGFHWTMRSAEFFCYFATFYHLCNLQIKIWRFRSSSSKETFLRWQKVSCWQKTNHSKWIRSRELKSFLSTKVDPVLLPCTRYFTFIILISLLNSLISSFLSKSFCIN